MTKKNPQGAASLEDSRRQHTRRLLEKVKFPPPLTDEEKNAPELSYGEQARLQGGED